MNFEKIYQRDRFANNTGVILDHISDTGAQMHIKVENHHLNGGDVVHGGVLFLLADISMAAIANHLNPISVSIQSDIRFLAAAVEGDILTAKATMLFGRKKLSNCHVDIVNQNGELIAIAEGMFHTKQIKVNS